MARIRTVKPEFWDDEILGSLPRDARLLFIGSWNFADDEGRIRWAAPSLKSKIFPYDEDLTIADVQKLMDHLERVGRVRSYTVDGTVVQTFAVIVNFNRHQRISHPQPSMLPAPPPAESEDDESAPRTLTEDSVMMRGTGADDARTDFKGIDITTPSSPASPRQLMLVPDPPPRAPRAESEPPGFADWWLIYPRKVGKRAAMKAYRSAVGRGITEDQLRAGGERHAKACRGKDAKYIPHPTTWLNQDRYADEPEISKTFVDCYGNVVARDPDPWGRFG